MREAFDGNVSKWIEYTRSGGANLRNEVALVNLRPHLPDRILSVLDVGGGTGEFAELLARDGHEVTLLDFSAEMLAEADRQCAGLNLRTVCADLGDIESLWGAESFDVVIAHSVLEFVPEAVHTVSTLTRVLCTGGVLSVMSGNRYHAPLRKALLEKDFEAARLGLDEEVPAVDLFGLPRRTFYPHELLKMAEECGLKVVGEYGVRIFADLLGGAAAGKDLLALELAAAARVPFRHLARFIQVVGLKGG